jgi:hypothetical protein
MIVNFEIDDSTLTDAIVSAVDDDWKSDICERLAESYDASDIADHISTYDVAQELDTDAVFANIEINYEELAEHIVNGSDSNFKHEVAGLMWQQFSEEFGASMKCVREEIAMINAALDARAVPFWKRWLKSGDQEEAVSS